MPDQRRWLVDGMNVIGSRPDGWWKDRDAAMARLVESLEQWVADTGSSVTVVFERPPRPPISPARVEIGHAPRGGRDAADDEIVRLLQADDDPAGVTVVTSDQGLAARVRATGAAVEKASRFRSRLGDR